MDSIVDDVEEERETEGSPANSQRCEDSGGWEVMRISLSVNHGDGPSSCGQYQGHNCQTDRIKENIVFKILEAVLT